MPKYRDLQRPVSTAAEFELFDELFLKYTKRSTTDWDAFGREWHHRAGLSAHRVEGADRAIHFTSVPLLKRHLTLSYRAGLRRDSLNNLTAFHARLQPTPPLSTTPHAIKTMLPPTLTMPHTSGQLQQWGPPMWSNHPHTDQNQNLFSLPSSVNPPLSQSPLESHHNVPAITEQAGKARKKSAPTNKRGGKGTPRICRECREKVCLEGCSKKAAKEKKLSKKSGSDVL